MAFVALHFNERLCALPASKEIVVVLSVWIPALGIYDVFGFRGGPEAGKIIQ